MRAGERARELERERERERERENGMGWEREWDGRESSSFSLYLRYRRKRDRRYTCLRVNDLQICPIYKHYDKDKNMLYQFVTDSLCPKNTNYDHYRSQPTTI